MQKTHTIFTDYVGKSFQKNMNNKLLHLKPRDYTIFTDCVIQTLN